MNQSNQPTAGGSAAPDDLEKASLDTVYEKLGASPEGLTSAEAKARIDTDEHGLKKLICFACGEEKHIANRHFRISGRTLAARWIELICVPKVFKEKKGN